VDNVKFVLNRLKDLPQIKYTKERAAFNVSEESDERAKELKKLRRDISDAEMREYWSDPLP